MKRLALVLAVTVLGTGCYVSSSTPPPPQVGSVILYWDFVRNAPAQTGGTVVYDGAFAGPSGACPQSSVEFVTVDAPGVAQVYVTCSYGGVQGVTIDNLPAGTDSFRVRGWRGAYAVYDETFSRSVPPFPAAAPQYYLDVHAVAAPIDLFAALFSDAGAQYYTLCSDALNPEIDFEVWDSARTLIESVVGVPCTDPAYPSFPVFVGNLDLDNYTVRMKGFTGAPPGTRTFDSCTSAAATFWAFDHFGSQIGVDGKAITLYTPPRCGP